MELWSESKLITYVLSILFLGKWKNGYFWHSLRSLIRSPFGSHEDFSLLAVAAAKSLQSCLTLCDPIDGSPPGSPVPGILQARTLEWVDISFSNAWKWKVKGKLLSRVRLFATPWTAVYQAPPSMRFSRQEYQRGLPFLSPYKQRYDDKMDNLEEIDEFLEK